MGKEERGRTSIPLGFLCTPTSPPVRMTLSSEQESPVEGREHGMCSSPRAVCAGPQSAASRVSGIERGSEQKAKAAQLVKDAWQGCERGEGG